MLRINGKPLPGSIITGMTYEPNPPTEEQLSWFRTDILPQLAPESITMAITGPITDDMLQDLFMLYENPLPTVMYVPKHLIDMMRRAWRLRGYKTIQQFQKGRRQARRRRLGR